MTDSRYDLHQEIKGMKIKLKKPVNRIWAIVWLVDLLFILSCLIISFMANEKIERLYSEQAAKRWQAGDMKFAQVSAFISTDAKTDQTALSNIRTAIMTKLKEDGYSDANKGGKPLCDAYYMESEQAITAENISVDVTLSGVGGDFFTLHPFPLKCGNYFSDEDLNLDRIVLDENASWNLFGSSDVEGLQVQIGRHIFTVAGVIRVPTDTVESEAYGEKARAFIPYQRMDKVGTEEKNITCYEAVLPNPIKSYAFNTLSSAFGFGEEEDKGENKDVVCVTNTERFDFFNLIGDLKTFKYVSMRKKPIAYPFWENEAIVVEHRLSKWLLFRLILIAFVVITVIVRISIWWIKREKTTFELITEWLDGMKDKRNIKLEKKKEKAKEDSKETEEEQH